MLRSIWSSSSGSISMYFIKVQSKIVFFSDRVDCGAFEVGG